MLLIHVFAPAWDQNLPREKQFEGTIPLFTKPSVPYPLVSINPTSSSRNTGGTFADVLKSEAAKNKSLKINHAALQRVMNTDGSLKQIDGKQAGRRMEGSILDIPFEHSLWRSSNTILGSELIPFLMEALLRHTSRLSGWSTLLIADLGWISATQLIRSRARCVSSIRTEEDFSCT